MISRRELLVGASVLALIPSAGVPGDPGALPVFGSSGAPLDLDTLARVFDRLGDRVVIELHPEQIEQLVGGFDRGGVVEIELIGSRIATGSARLVPVEVEPCNGGADWLGLARGPRGAAEVISGQRAAMAANEARRAELRALRG